MQQSESMGGFDIDMGMRLLLGCGLAALSILMDQSTKIWVSTNLFYHESIPIFGNTLRITYTRNPGIAFGISSGPLTGLPLLFITLLGSIFIAYILVMESRISKVRSAALGMILGGAVGNLIDRLFHGDVIDFIDVGINNSYRWPIFNVADASVVAGLLLILVAGKSPKSKSEDFISAESQLL